MAINFVGSINQGKCLKMLFRFEFLSFCGVLKVFRPYLYLIIMCTNTSIYLVVKMKFISRTILECGRIL